jgi:acyl-CoA synthetase (AMP-forming)/AMP-acid ligase II
LRARLIGTWPQRARLADDVTVWARERMAGYKVPSLLWVVSSDELPQTATGKVSKRLLKEKLVGTER